MTNLRPWTPEERDAYEMWKEELLAELDDIRAERTDAAEPPDTDGPPPPTGKAWGDWRKEFLTGHTRETERR